ncbi:hypothetical protein CK203_006034 [Vitis vinifera]|uniref:Uncharacterized protein n=1 Tax=Vitis vinifera TaxID=29760 RepID=A0A438K5K0_VITVI|nr:hypothetical protein CK203_006034 [Vitis vinifera]
MGDEVRREMSESERERERERLRAREIDSDGMCDARRTGGKGRQAASGWNLRRLSWKWWKGEEQP